MMAVNSIYRPLLHAFSKVGAHMQAYVIQRLMASTNAMYEATFDAPAVGAATQTVKGHNHGSNGGGPMPRGVAWSEDMGKTGLIGLEFGKTTYEYEWELDHHCRYRVSPYLNNRGFLEGRILYSAQNTSVEMTIRESISNVAGPKTEIQLPITYKTGEDEAYRWETFYVPLGAGTMNGPRFSFRGLSVEDGKPSTLTVYSLLFSEVSGVSYRKIGEVI